MDGDALNAPITQGCAEPAASYLLEMHKRPAAPTDSLVDALYTTPPSAFVAVRNATAQQLAASGDTRAREVTALSRPTTPVWAVNLAARGEARIIHALLDAADEVVKAHRLLLGGSSGEVLHAADRALSAALEQAVLAASRAAKAGGHPLSTPMVQRVRATLRALALGPPENRDRLRAGRVLAESGGPGLDALEALSPLQARRAPARSPRKATPEAGHRQDALAKEQRARALVEAREATREAEHDLRDAEAAASQLRAEAEDARRRADEAARRARDADAQVETAGQRGESAARHLSDLEARPKDSR